MSKYDAVIFGGGLTGLSVCYNIMKSHDDASVLILESASELGGLAKSYQFQGVTFDFGPHVFRTSDQALLAWVSSLVRLKPYKTDPAIFKYGRIFDSVIPVITKANIENLPPAVRNRAIEDLSSCAGTDSSRNFQESLENKIGHTLYWEFFGQYSRKWWGTEPSFLSAELAPKNVSVGETAGYAHLTTKFDKPQQEFYPALGGYGSIATTLAGRILSDFGKRVTAEVRSSVSEITSDGGLATSVVTADGVEHAVKGKIISTMPFSSLCSILGIQCSLSYRSEICVFLTVSKSQTNRLSKSWLYFPEDDVVFGRIYEMGQFSELNESHNLRGLVAEITCASGDAIWSASDEELSERVVADLDRLGLVKKKDVVGSMVVRGDFVYPIFTVDYRKEKERVTEIMRERASNIVALGRTGGFNYWNSDSVLSQFHGIL